MFRDKVLKRCPKGHRMDIQARHCRRCSPGHPAGAEVRSAVELTMINKVEARPSDRTRIMTREEAQAVASAVRSTARLVGISGRLAGTNISLGPGTLRIGKAPLETPGGQRLAIEEDNFLSRDHAAVELTDEGVTLRDAGSTNGCFVNGTRVQEAVLQHGDRIQLGESVFRFERMT